ncbi:MAG: hypothetical protein JWO64_3280, partial [Hyphomicrobiales bacterium]|nr:hypothetical protein [Hyphomicrobiales bacterium]
AYVSIEINSLTPPKCRLVSTDTKGRNMSQANWGESAELEWFLRSARAGLRLSTADVAAVVGDPATPDQLRQWARRGRLVPDIPAPIKSAGASYGLETAATIFLAAVYLHLGLNLKIACARATSAMREVLTKIQDQPLSEAQAVIDAFGLPGKTASTPVILHDGDLVDMDVQPVSVVRVGTLLILFAMNVHAHFEGKQTYTLDDAREGRIPRATAED